MPVPAPVTSARLSASFPVSLMLLLLTSPDAVIPGCPASIDHQDMAGDIFRIVGSKEEHGGCNVLGRARRAQRDVAEHAVSLLILRAVEHRSSAFGKDGPGSDSIHPYPVLAHFQRVRAGEICHARFGRRVGALHPRRYNPEYR